MSRQGPKDVLTGASATFRLVLSPRQTSASAQVLEPDGSVAATPTPTLDAVDTTVASASDAFTLTLTSATGVEVGGHYWIGGAHVARVRSVVGSVVTLTAPLPATPSGGDAFQGVEWSVTVAAAQTGNVGQNYRVRVYEGDVERVAWFHVVRQRFEQPITRLELTEMLGELAPGSALLDDQATLERIVDECDDRVRNRLMAQASWPNLMGDPRALKEAGRLAAMIRLADYAGLVPPNRDPDTYTRDLRVDFRRAVGDAVHSLHAYDAANDGDATQDSAPIISVRLHR